MDEDRYIDLMREVFDNLQEYYPVLERAGLRDYIARIIWKQGVVSQTSVQKDYERLRDRIEAFLEKHGASAKDWFPGMDLQ